MWNISIGCCRGWRGTVVKLDKRELIPTFLQSEYCEGFQDELLVIQEYVLGHRDLHNLEYLEGLLERITNLVVEEVDLLEDVSEG